MTRPRRVAPTLWGMAALGSSLTFSLAFSLAFNLGCGAEVARGGVPRDASNADGGAAASPANQRPVQQPTDLIPGDLELVLRVDLSKIRASLGPEASSELLSQAAIDDGGDGLLRLALQEAEVVWLALRVADASAGDRVTVVRTIKQRDVDEDRDGAKGSIDDAPTAAPDAPSDSEPDARIVPDRIQWKRSDTALEGVARFEARSPPRRGGTARVFSFGPDTGADRTAVFVSPVEVMSVERVLQRGPDSNRGQPEARGLLSLDYRARQLTPDLARRFPSLASLWAGILRITGIVDVSGQRLDLDGSIRCKNGGAAEKVKRFFDTIREATARRPESGYAQLLSTLELTREGSVVRVRWPVATDAIRALLTAAGPSPAPPPTEPSTDGQPPDTAPPEVAPTIPQSE